MNEFDLPRRPGRNRSAAGIRGALAETRLDVSNLLYPMFLVDGSGKRDAISSMPGIFRQSEDLLLHEVEACMKAGLRLFALFPAVDDSLKDKTASYASSKGNFYARTNRAVTVS